MVSRLIAAWPLERYQLWLAFADGTEGAIDLETEMARPLVERLPDLRQFRLATLDRDRNRVVWPNHAGVAGELLYERLRRRRPQRLRR